MAIIMRYVEEIMIDLKYLGYSILVVINQSYDKHMYS